MKSNHNLKWLSIFGLISAVAFFLKPIVSGSASAAEICLSLVAFVPFAIGVSLDLKRAKEKRVV